MRGRAAELLCGARRVAPLFGEVSTEARTRVGVYLSRVSAGPASFGEGFRPRGQHAGPGEGETRTSSYLAALRGGL